MFMIILSIISDHLSAHHSNNASHASKQHIPWKAMHFPSPHTFHVLGTFPGVAGVDGPYVNLGGHSGSKGPRQLRYVLQHQI
jgi:hypothetical protein